MLAANPELVASRPSATVLRLNLHRQTSSTRAATHSAGAEPGEGHGDDTRFAPCNGNRHPHRVAARSAACIPQAGRHLLRRADCSHRIFPRRVRRAPALARRTSLCRSGGAVPVPARPRQQPSRVCHRPHAGRLSWRSLVRSRQIAAILLGAMRGAMAVLPGRHRHHRRDILPCRSRAPSGSWR